MAKASPLIEDAVVFDADGKGDQSSGRFCVARRKEVITTANDLAGMLYTPYTSYEDVGLELAMRLPGFLIDGSYCSNLELIRVIAKAGNTTVRMDPYAAARECCGKPLTGKSD